MRVIVNKPELGLIVVVAMLSQWCTGAGQSNLPASQSVAKSSLEKEAKQEAEAFLKHAYYKCGDSYFMRRQFLRHNFPRAVIVDERPLFTQIKGFSWKIEGEEIIPPLQTEADRLNGLPQKKPGWEGWIIIMGTVSRAYGYPGNSPDERARASGQWFPWTDGVLAVDPRRFRLTKQNDKWEIDFPLKGLDIPVDCSAIPQASLKVSQVPDPTPPPIKNQVSPVPATIVADPKLVPPNPLPKKSP